MSAEPLCLSYRLMVTMLCTMAMLICFAEQSGMGSAMVCMVLDTAAGHVNSTNNTNNTRDPPTADRSLDPVRTVCRSIGRSVGLFVRRSSLLSPFFRVPPFLRYIPCLRLSFRLTDVSCISLLHHLVHKIKLSSLADRVHDALYICV